MHKTILSQSPNEISDYVAIKEIAVNQNLVLVSLIAAIQTLKYIDILNITFFEDEYVENQWLSLVCAMTRLLT